MKLPEEVTTQISRRALEIARDLAPRKTGRGSLGMRATSQKGQIGIEIPPDVIHMYYQDEGIQPFIMEGLAGKTIPIRRPDGSIIFRRATTTNIGKKIVSRDESGQLIGSRVAWRFPGLKPKHFIEKALQQATQEWISGLSSREIEDMLDESDVSELMRVLRGES